MFSLITNFLEPFSYFVYAGTFALAIYADKDWKKKMLLFYYITASIMIFYACLLAHVNTWGDNNWLYNLFFFITVITLSAYYHEVIDSKEKKNAIRTILLVNLALFTWYDVVLKQFHFSYNNYVVACCFLSIIIYSFFYFHQLFTNIGDESILQRFDFWLVSGYLLYFLGAFFVILFYKNATIEQRAFLWGLQNIILFLSAIITLSGNLWVSYKNRLA